MYEESLDPEDRKRYQTASIETSLEPELRVMRARLDRALKDRDGKTVESACAMVVRLVRAQAALGGRGELAKMLDDVGESIVAQEEES
ncbi:MAG TPA: hypothetical protein VG815_17835 [Chloroflexota bacterium]|nr:hypothetical protein [Chloroflexota bacterium]